MSPQFLAMLPEELQATAHDAEQIAGCEIAVVPNASASEWKLVWSSRRCELQLVDLTGTFCFYGSVEASKDTHKQL